MSAFKACEQMRHQKGKHKEHKGRKEKQASALQKKSSL
jgi:hypothetical protein